MHKRELTAKKLKLSQKTKKEIIECFACILSTDGSRSDDVAMVKELSNILLGYEPTYDEQKDEWSFTV